MSATRRHLRLGVNIDHVATIRNARGIKHPDPVRAAKLAAQAGADGITAHLREDRRHISDDDIDRLSAEIDLPLNLEMAATDEMVRIALSVRPEMCTLVPERREERTTEGGLDVMGAGDVLARRAKALSQDGIKVSFFIAAEAGQIEAARALGAAQIELHTGEYAHGKEGELGRLRDGANRARSLGLEVAAGHGLTQDNVPALVSISVISELNIGHALVADAVFLGMRGAVRAYRDAIGRGLH